MDALLVAYADGELDETSVAEVEAYLAATPAAQRTLAIYRETAALLRAAFPESRYGDGEVPAEDRPVRNIAEATDAGCVCHAVPGRSPPLW